MSQPGRIQPFAVVIHAHRSINNLVFTIMVDIGDCQVVIPLSGESLEAGFGGIEDPAAGQLAIAPIPSRQHASAIISTPHHGTGSDAVEIGHGSQKTIRPIPVAVIPAISSYAAPAAQIASRRNVIDSGERCSRQPIEDREIFRACKNFPERSRLLTDPICIRIADHFAYAVNGSIGSFAGYLRSPVAIEIVDQKLGIMCAFANVVPEIDSPQQSAGDVGSNAITF